MSRIFKKLKIEELQRCEQGSVIAEKVHVPRQNKAIGMLAIGILIVAVTANVLMIREYRANQTKIFDLMLLIGSQQGQINDLSKLIVSFESSQKEQTMNLLSQFEEFNEKMDRQLDRISQDSIVKFENVSGQFEEIDLMVQKLSKQNQELNQAVSDIKVFQKQLTSAVAPANQNSQNPIVPF